VFASNVIVDDTIGRTTSPPTATTSLQDYVDYSRTHIGPVPLVWEVSDLPAAAAGVRTIDTPTFVLADVTDPTSTFDLQASVVGLGPTISGLRGNSAGPGPALSSSGQSLIEVGRIGVGNISADAAAVGLRIEDAGIAKVHDVLIVPASIAAQFHNVGFGDASDMFIQSSVQGLQVTGTTGALGVALSAGIAGGGPTPASYDALSISGTVGVANLQVDVTGIDGPGTGHGLYVDPTTTAAQSAIIFRNSSGDGQLIRPTGLTGLDPEVFVVAVKPDRPSTPYGGIEYNDIADELLVSFSGGLPATSSLPSNAPISGVVSPRGTMDCWEVDVTDPAEVVWRYLGKESFLGRFAWLARVEKSSGGTDLVDVFIEKITGGPTLVPDTLLEVTASQPSQLFSLFGGTVNIDSGDEFRFRLTNKDTTTSLLVGTVNIEILRV
jgi:hypothetical protein